jgi:hypothetical protein
MNEQDIISKKLQMYERVSKDFPFLKDHFEIQPTYQLTSQGQRFGGFNVRIFTDIKGGRIYLDTVVEKKLEDLGLEKIKDKLEEVRENLDEKNSNKAKKKLDKLLTSY